MLYSATEQGHHADVTCQLSPLPMVTFISRQCYSVILYSQGHFGVGGTVEALNTTLTQWEAAGVLPVNRVSEIHLQIFAG